ncbi:MAG: D-serine ammonia-lyase [Alkalispirochaeta sp.]
MAEVLNTPSDDTVIQGRTFREWREADPAIAAAARLEEVTWINPAVRPVSEVLPGLDIGAADVADASARLRRFAPYIARAFPETRDAAGIIESPVKPLDRYAGRGERILMKCDNELPVSGSIKARGGIYEVLTYAESLAESAGLLGADRDRFDYARLGDADFREFFSGYSIAVGSTGNLGLSIGLMGAQLGFSVTVHMSADARRWKKELLRSRGVTVIEYADDYSAAVTEGRRQATADPRCHFVDDENSVTLFMGYAVAAERLAAQLTGMGLTVDGEHPLYVYLPCGVGGGPGGVAFGLKLIWGDAVRCFFMEPTHAPAMLLGLATGLHEEVSVHDFGIDNRTAADGLAVGRPSGFVGRRMHHMIDGVCTVSDESMFRELARAYRDYGTVLEPSAAAGLVGPERTAMTLGDATQTATSEDRNGRGRAVSGATHLVWATGGSMVPADEMKRYRETGMALLNRM